MMDLSLGSGRLVLYPLRPQRKKNGTECRSTHMSAVCRLIAGQAQSRLMAEHRTRCDCGCACIRKSAVTGNGCGKGGKKTGAEQNCSEFS